VRFGRSFAGSTAGIPFFLAFLLTLAVSPAQAQTGKVAGKVLDAKTGEPLPFANVVVVGTGLGAMTQDDGSFFIPGVPAGPQEIKVSYIGYVTATQGVVVFPDQTVEVTFRLEPTVAKREEKVEVHAERPLVEVEKASTIRSFTAEEITQLTVEPSLQSVVEQQPGITQDRGRIHFRGGRADEVALIVEGVRMKDVLSGISETKIVSTGSVAEVDIITGGFDAKYGEALSGVVRARLKDGTRNWHGSVSYETDRPFNDWKTDIAEFQLSGPNLLLLGVGRLLGVRETPTFFLDITTQLTDTYLPSIGDLPGKHLVSSYQESFLGRTFRYGRFFYPRADNSWRLAFKTAWKVGRKDKLSLTFTKYIAFDEGFGSVDIGEIDRNNYRYPWAWSRRLDHYYTYSWDQNSFILSWKHTLGANATQDLRFTRFFSAAHRDVAGKHWTEWTPEDRARDRDLPEDQDTPFFIDVGSAPNYRDRYVETWGLAGSWLWTPGAHKLEWGFEAQYENVQYLTLDASTIVCDSISCPKPLGDEFDLFHVYPNTGALYVQDRMEYESFIANIGLRYDYWFPGEQVERLLEEANRPTITPGLREEFYRDTHGLFGHRFKGHLSPRIAVSFPITARDKIFFNYGHFSQRPAYFYVYAKSGSQSSEAFPRIGNPNLNPEVSVQYELGLAHQFRDDMAFKVTVFNKDIYDYPTATTIVLSERTTGRSNFFIYRNLDYARSRGIELELKKRRTHYWSGNISYTYSVAKGKSSDPNLLRQVLESGGDARETELEEIYLWWNRPHKLTAWFNFQVYEDEDPPTLFGWKLPRDFSFNAYYLIRSGRAYTPKTPDGRDAGQRYSKNGPYDTTLNFTLRKGFRFGGLRWVVFLEGWNVFNHRTAISFDWATGKPWEFGKGSLETPYENPAYLNLSDEELVAAVGRTVGPDETLSEVARSIRRTILANYYRYSDPSFYGRPRHFRLGVSMEW
jgi:outer membrane receptor protein involved in Fe transport